MLHSEQTAPHKFHYVNFCILAYTNTMIFLIIHCYPVPTSYKPLANGKSLARTCNADCGELRNGSQQSPNVTNTTPPILHSFKNLQHKFFLI